MRKLRGPRWVQVMQTAVAELTQTSVPWDTLPCRVLMTGLFSILKF